MIKFSKWKVPPAGGQARRNKLFLSWGPLVIAAPLAGSTHSSKKCRKRLLFGVIYFYQTFKTTSLENIPYGPFGAANLELATFSL